MIILIEWVDTFKNAWGRLAILPDFHVCFKENWQLVNTQIKRTILRNKAWPLAISSVAASPLQEEKSEHFLPCQDNKIYIQLCCFQFCFQGNRLRGLTNCYDNIDTGITKKVLWHGRCADHFYFPFSLSTLFRAVNQIECLFVLYKSSRAW